MTAAVALAACQALGAAPTATPAAGRAPRGQGEAPGQGLAGRPGDAITGTVPFTGAGQTRGGSAMTGTLAVTGAGQTRSSGVITGTATPTRTATVASVAGVGALAISVPDIQAAFETSGKVVAVNVVAGQAVRKGEVIAELDPVDLRTALKQAQDSLAQKELDIATALEPTKQRDIDNATSSLNSAWAAYADLVKGPTQLSIDNALRSWNQARNSLWGSQLNRDQACHLNPPDPNARNFFDEPGCKVARLGVESAEARERAAYQAYLDAQKPATDDALAKAWSSVAQAQSTLASLKSGVTAEKKKVYDLQLQQARVGVERAQRNLARARLVSPCDCIVQTVTLAPGANADGAVTLVSAAQPVFQATNISERDVIHLVAGLTATVRLKAYDQTFSGRVAAILPVASGVQGTTALYTVLIELDPAAVTLLPGMTGSVDIRLR